MAELPVVKLGVWQNAHPTLMNTSRPLLMDAAPPGVSGDGCGGARKRMKNANFSIELIASTVVVAWTRRARLAPPVPSGARRVSEHNRPHTVATMTGASEANLHPLDTDVDTSITLCDRIESQGAESAERRGELSRRSGSTANSGCRITTCRKRKSRGSPITSWREIPWPPTGARERLAAWCRASA